MSLPSTPQVLMSTCQSVRRSTWSSGAAPRYFSSSTPSSKSWWTILNSLPAEVANSGSMARDVLAMERTFLAWARTGLGFVGAGSALAAAYYNENHKSEEDTLLSEQPHAPLFLADRYILPASTLLIINGAVLLGFATHRYLHVLSALVEHKTFPIRPRGTLIAVAFTAVNTSAALTMVFKSKRNRG